MIFVSHLRSQGHILNILITKNLCMIPSSCTFHNDHLLLFASVQFFQCLISNSLKVLLDTMPIDSTVFTVLYTCHVFIPLPRQLTFHIELIKSSPFIFTYERIGLINSERCIVLIFFFGERNCPMTGSIDGWWPPALYTCRSAVNFSLEWFYDFSQWLSKATIPRSRHFYSVHNFCNEFLFYC